MRADVSQPRSLEAFNTADDDAALALISHWCAAPQWVKAVCSARPFSSIEQLKTATTQHWQSASEADLLDAFAAHPVIGDVELLRSKYAAQANAEQGQVLAADDAVIAQLAAQNTRYSKRHGFTFIVFATGKSAEEMLGLLNARIDNTTAEEMRNAAAEQLKIMQLRLTQTVTTDDPLQSTRTK